MNVFHGIHSCTVFLFTVIEWGPNTWKKATSRLLYKQLYIYETKKMQNIRHKKNCWYENFRLHCSCDTVSRVFLCRSHDKRSPYGCTVLLPNLILSSLSGTLCRKLTLRNDEDLYSSVPLSMPYVGMPTAWCHFSGTWWECVYLCLKEAKHNTVHSVINVGGVRGCKGWPDS